MIQVSVSMTILYGIYWMFLKKDTFFSANRFFLMGSLIISSTISFFDFNWLLPKFNDSYGIILDTITIGTSEIQGGMQPYFSTLQVIIIIYICGVTIFLLRYLFQILQLIRIVFANNIEPNSGISIITLDEPVSPFSFFNYIILPNSGYNEKDIRSIIDHELVHVKQKHTIDVLVLDLLCIVFWFNPVIWLYRSSIKLIHEYLADEGVLFEGHKTYFYQNLLLNQTLNIQVNDLVNNFNHSLIKRRFIMMSKSRSSTKAKLKLLLILPAIMTIIMFTMAGDNIFAQENAPDAPNVPKIEKENLPPAPQLSMGVPVAPLPDALPQDEKVVYKKVDQAPQFPGGKQAFSKFMQSNITYPKSALESNISGVIYISFVLDKNGAVSDVAVKQAKFSQKDKDKTAEEELIKKAIDVVSSMPNWKPGIKDGKSVNVAMTLPVKFALDEHKKDVNKDIKSDVNTDIHKDQQKKKQYQEQQKKSQIRQNVAMINMNTAITTKP